MQKNMFFIALLFVCSTFSARAQVSFSINISSQPEWGPTGYDHVEYYYIPDMDAYYDVNRRVYIYMDGGVWVTRSYAPPRYRDVDLYRVHKVVINEPEPWKRHDVYRGRYASYRGRYDQTPLRDHRDNGNHYGQNKRGDDHHDNGNHNGQYKHGDHDKGHDEHDDRR